jgi:hypothetical protein
MRKSVKLAAASAIAAVALVGGSATAATAAGHDDDHPGVNVCGNGDNHALVSAKDNGDVETDDIDVTGVNHQVICQVGENNEANNVNSGDVAGDDLTKEIFELLEIDIED